MTRRRLDLYDRVRRDAITLWRKASKRHLAAAAFGVIATIQQTSPALLPALLAHVWPGLSVETATAILAALVLSVTRVVDQRKARRDAEQ